MTESPPSASSGLERESADKLRNGLVADYLCATNSKDEDKALAALRKDEFRLAMAGMTPGERARAAAVDELKEKMPGLIRTVAVVSLSWVVGERLAEHFPNMRVALGSAGVGLFASGAAVETTYKLMRSRETMHPKVAVLAMSLAALRPFARLAMEIGAGISGGVVTRGVLDGFQAAAQAGAGEGGAGDGGDVTDRGADMGRGDSGDLRQGPEAPVVSVPSGREAPVLSVPDGEFVNRAGEVAAQEAEEMAEAAQGAAEIANRLAVLNDGGVIGNLAKEANAAPWDIVRKIVGDVPHGGEITNILTRALRDKLSGLHEGAIREAIKPLQPIFDTIDQVVAGSGVPYTEGGRAAVEAMRGFNSPEAQAIRAGNLGDMEAAGSLFNNVLKPVLSP